MARNTGYVHTTPEEFENGSFTLKMHQTFPVHIAPEEFEKYAWFE